MSKSKGGIENGAEEIGHGTGGLIGTETIVDRKAGW
jgi:hypothetical protein